MIAAVLLGMLYAVPPQPSAQTRNGITKTSDENATCYRDERRSPLFIRYCDLKENGPGLDTIEFGALTGYATKEARIVDAGRMPLPGVDVANSEDGTRFAIRRGSKPQKDFEKIYLDVVASFNAGK